MKEPCVEHVQEQGNYNNVDFTYLSAIYILQFWLKRYCHYFNTCIVISNEENYV